ncbi:MAG: release factor glutamine methyltransferase [Planctomycetota bacterium]
MSETQGAARVWTSLDLIKWTADYFRKKEVDSPRLQAELLLAEVLGCDRVRLYVDFEKPVAPEHLEKFRAFVKRRGELREPLQYVMGHAPFLGLKLKVTPAVLIPRPETEELAAWGVERLKERAGEELKAVDLGTGSGCLALYTAAQDLRTKVWAVDANAAALEVARENGTALNLSERVTWLEGDLFAPLPAELRGRVGLLLSNPPYIDPAERSGLQPEVRDHEPAQALFAEAAGRAVLDRIVDEAGAWLESGGWMGLEIAPAHADALSARIDARGDFEAVEVARDLNGKDRFIRARKRA